MAKVVTLPKTVISRPGGRVWATEINGAIVHSDKPISIEARAAIGEVIEAAKKKINVDS